MRTTADDVKKVIEVDDTINGGDISAFIAAANELVTERCSNSGYTDIRLELIERWLAAHFYAIRDKQVASESAGGVSASYQNSLGLMLQSTMYGQQALILDTRGSLAALSKGAETGQLRRVGMIWLGTQST